MLNQDYKEILSALSAHKAEYLLVGAYAMAVHGYPRSTGDMDIFVRATPENAEKVFSALEAFGAPLQELTKEDLSKPGIVFQIGIIPRRIDIITKIDGVSFEEAQPDSRLVSIDDLQIPVISLHHLIKNKASTGREKDRLDVESLRQKKV